MKFMQCTCCKSSVQINPTGICLACQRGFIGVPQEDSLEQHEKKKDLKKLKTRKKKIEDALKKN